MNTLERGDKIRTPGRIGVIWHYGIYLGVVNGTPLVVHNSKTEKRVGVATLESFCEGRSVYIEKRPPAERVEAVVEAALSWVGTQYDLFNFNCESFANVVHEGRASSPQVGRGLALGAALGAYGLLSWLGSRPTYDADVARYRDRNGRFVRR